MTEKPPLTVRVGYCENPDWVPNPLDQSGYLRTDDVIGGQNSDITQISPTFAAFRAGQLDQASQALASDSVPVTVVVSETETADEARARVEAALEEIRQHPITVGGPSPEAQKAAVDTSADAPEQESSGNTPEV